jgi:hypothetical protein
MQSKTREERIRQVFFMSEIQARFMFITVAMLVSAVLGYVIPTYSFIQSLITTFTAMIALGGYLRARFL